MAPSRHSKSEGLTFRKAIVPAVIPAAGFALVLGAAATAVTGPVDRSGAAGALIVADNPSEDIAAVSRDYVRTDVDEVDESRIARSSADEDGVQYLNRHASVRTAPTSSAASVAQLEEGAEVTVTSQTSRGYTLVLHDGVERWIYTDYLSDEPPVEEVEEPQASQQASSGNSTNSAPSVGQVSGDTPGAQAANAAIGQAGNRYTRGGTSPSTGFDCSGLTSWAYSQAGISLPRTSGAQAGYGTRISRADLSPGDLIHWPGHVGMYIGNGQIVHASTPSTGVQITSIERGHRSSPTGYTRPWS